MRTFLIVLTVLLAQAITTIAQIPNNGFETWTTVGSYEDPVDWATMNAACAGPFYSCTKSTDHYPASVGNYSIRVENNTSLTQMTGGYGMAITDSFSYPFKPAFPVIGNPTSLCGYYKYNSLNNDSMFIRIVFFENSIMLGFNTFITGITTSTWTSFNLPVTYSSADSATLYFSAFYPSSYSSGPKGNSVLQVDNLSFDDLISLMPEQASKKTLISLYPNPASDFVFLQLDDINNADLSINFYNVMGALIKSAILLQSNQSLNVGDLSNGVYMVEIKSKEWSVKQKLLIQR